MSKIRVQITGDLPTELFLAFVQHVRAFDAEHADCHFEMFANSNDWTPDQIMEMIAKVEPPLPFTRVQRKQ